MTRNWVRHFVASLRGSATTPLLPLPEGLTPTAGSLNRTDVRRRFSDVWVEGCPTAATSLRIIAELDHRPVCFAYYRAWWLPEQNIVLLDGSNGGIARLPSQISAWCLLHEERCPHCGQVISTPHQNAAPHSVTP